MKNIFFAILFAVLFISFYSCKKEEENNDLTTPLDFGLFEMVYVEGGTFQMGSNDSEAYDNEKPVHTVTVNDFYIGKYEITNIQYCEFLNAEGNQTEGVDTWLDISDEDCQIEIRNDVFYPKNGKDDYPVIEVTWYGAKRFCEWAGGRLPTEAEWEYAARGGNESENYKYSGSNNIDEVAWYGNNSNDETHNVGTKTPNELGIYDMSGNVWEWCSDWYGSNYYSNSPTENPTGTTSSSYRVLRGGSWNSNAERCRPANRSRSTPDNSYNYLGFRFAFVP